MTQIVDSTAAVAADPYVLYRFYSADDSLLYIGVTSDFDTRRTAHRRYSPWWPEVARATEEPCNGRSEALAAEAEAIRSECPHYNVSFNPGMKRRCAPVADFHPSLQHIRDAKVAYDKAVAEATDTFHNAIADALRAGEHVQDVAEASGYHRNHVGRIRRAAGIPDARRRPKGKSGND